MALPNLLPKWISNRIADPEGTAPKGLITKVGVMLLAVLMAVVILLAPNEEGGRGQTPTEPLLPPPGGPAAVAQGRQGIQNAEDRRTSEASQQQRRERHKLEAAERARGLEEQWRRQQAESEASAAGVAGNGAYASEELTPEQQLYESIRLERIQRLEASLRANPVALSFREAGKVAPHNGSEVTATEPPAESEPVSSPAPPPAPPVATTPAEQALVEGDLVRADPQPRAPHGWERIEGGQWIEAVLVTQIRGDSPGPAIARVATPFWSRDRQRILIPRGARFIGRAQAVNAWQQARLTVTFDRLIFNNFNLRLPFAGLSQAGEAGLHDKVNRHYLATFGAAGAVGVISGLTLRNTQSYGFNQPAGQAARMEAGRALGEAASSIMNRYLNRLPTITIRAGQRIRIYFTSDLLVPRRPA